MMRFVLVVALALVAVGGFQSRALAEKEYCPARALMTPLGTTFGERFETPSFTYGLLLDAASPRTVSGTISAHTDMGWFSIPFKDVQLTAWPAQYTTPLSNFERTIFESRVVFVRFPQPVLVSSVYVTSAAATGDGAFGWEGKGTVTCLGGSDDFTFGVERAEKQAIAILKDPVRVPPVVPPDAKAVLAVTDVAPGPIACNAPFTSARITELRLPTLPDMAFGVGGRSIVALAISAEGKLEDAWLWGSSGVGPYDSATLDVARNAKYVPKRAFCRNVPSLYLFKEDYRP